jgi:hypothetical protein
VPDTLSLRVVFMVAGLMGDIILRVYGHDIGSNRGGITCAPNVFNGWRYANERHTISSPHSFREDLMKSILGGLSIAGTLLMTIGLCAAPSEARITRIEISKIEPAFEGAQFGAVGTYERVIGRAHGEVDPNLRANAIIQDIDHAPRNAEGFVEYVTDVDILRPADRSKGNGILFFNVVNRGNKGGVFNADIPFGLPQNLADNNAPKVAGDGFMMKQGYTLVWMARRHIARKQPYDPHCACGKEFGRLCYHRNRSRGTDCSGSHKNAQSV